MDIFRYSELLFLGLLMTVTSIAAPYVKKDFVDDVIVDGNSEKLIVIIPTYEPPEEFIDYAATVAEFACELVVVNDGSSHDYDDIFEKIQQIENVKYIRC